MASSTPVPASSPSSSSPHPADGRGGLDQLHAFRDKGARLRRLLLPRAGGGLQRPGHGRLPLAGAEIARRAHRPERRREGRADLSELDLASYVGPGVLTYHLHRNGVVIWEGTLTGYRDRAVARGTSYEYLVVAINAAGLGDASSAVQVTPTDWPWPSADTLMLIVGCVAIIAIGTASLILV